MAETKSLVIVESPAKARTIARFLGGGYVVESSIGHIRDLPRNAKDVPEEFKKKPWARLGVDVDHGFRPLYVIDPDKKSQISRLKALLKESSALYLATDEDREGESIAWHLLEVLKPRVPVQRMVFHEITLRAIEEAIQNPRQVDRRLVDAQEARRILDRLYGYEVSPVLWKKVMPKLSAGRVQSVATRIIVEREWERMRFVAAQYWDVAGTFSAGATSAEDLTATLAEVNGRRVATGKDFSERGKLEGNAIVLDQVLAERLANELVEGTFTVTSVARKPHRRAPSPPFMTSTLQQEAGRKLRFSAARTMRAAQRLYEGGYITYMRTDSTTLSETAVAATRAEIGRQYGAEYLPAAPRLYTKKVKNAQEAHEAIRPAGDTLRSPENVSREVGHDEARLYELVWMRTVASQMKDARLEAVTVQVAGTAHSGEKVVFVARGNTILFPGFLRAYVEGSDDPSSDLEQRERPIPKLNEGQVLAGKAFAPRGHETQPPARFTEASLVRRLEELGVGRPSTYAAIISTIQDRGYVWKKGTALVPSFTAFAVIELLKQHFGDLVDYAFTARMEDALDAIAGGDEQPVPWLTRFYFGRNAEAGSDPARDTGASGPMDMGLKGLVAARLQQIDARAINSLPLGTDDMGRAVLVRVGRHGAYLQRGDDTASIPDDIEPDQLTLARAVELLDAPNGDTHLGEDPETGAPIWVRRGRFGPYVQLGDASGGKQKPRTASLLRSMSPDSLSLQDALRLLSLPRTVGVDPADGQPITAQLGRYGPYVAKGSQSRSLPDDESVFGVTLDEALELLSKPRQRQNKGAEPLRTVGIDAVSGRPITVREGRFGPYVTDGETNASLRKGDNPRTIDELRAQELLQARRDRGPSTTKKSRKKAAPPPSGKKVTAARRKPSPTGSTEGERPRRAAGGSKSAARSKASKPKTAGTKARRSAGNLVLVSNETRH